MNKREREKVYSAIVAAGVLKFHVTARSTRSELTAQGIIADNHGDGVRFTVFIDDETAPMIHWHGAARPLNPGMFDSVNPVHGTKATSYCADWNDLIGELSAVAELAQAGKLFRGNN